MTTRAEISKSAETEGGHTKLMRAALEGVTAIVEELLAGGADPNEIDNEGRTALMFAAANSQTPAAKALLERGGNVNVVANVVGTALMLAAASGDSEIIRT